MPQPRPKNFYDQIVDAIGSRIVAGLHAEGTQLPTEAQLAETYGVSRLLIREAMKALASKGLVSIRPRTGTHVLPRQQWNLFDPAVLAWHGDMRSNARLLEDLMELRQAIEPLAARLAAERATPACLDTLGSAFAAMERATDKRSYVEADLQFHAAVMKSCGNQFLVQLETTLSAVWRASFQASSDEWGPDAQALGLHRSLLQAIETGDAAAAEQAVLALIRRAMARIGDATPASVPD